MAFKPKNKESLGNVLTVSVVLCLVCSAVVSVAAVALKPRQLENEKLAKQRNRLLAARVIAPDVSDSDEIAAAYGRRVRTQWVDLRTGEPVPAPPVDSKEADFEAAADDESLSAPIPAVYQLPGRRPDLSPVYQILSEDGSKVERLVLPVTGRGLWSTLRAYLALDVNLDEPNPRDRFPIAGITFYEQAETAGLGAEVENPLWQAEWNGRFAFTEEWTPEFEVAKQAAAEGSDAARYQVDALAGATITSNGVEYMINYWLSSDHEAAGGAGTVPGAYGNYLRKLTPELLEEDVLAPQTEDARMEEEAEMTA